MVGFISFDFATRNLTFFVTFLLCHHYECTLVKEVKPVKHLSPFLICH